MIYISIVLSAYNHEKSILQCLDSIIAQENADMQIECIVVDDCSTDDTLGIIRRRVGGYKGNIVFRIYRHQTHHGLSRTRNTGLQRAQGYYVMFVNGVDQLRNGCIDTYMVNLMRHWDVDVIAGNVYNLCLQRNLFSTLDSALALRGKGDVICHELLRNHLYLYANNKLVRREVLTANLITFDERMEYGDIQWTFTLFSNISSVVLLPDITYEYGRRETGAIGQTLKWVNMFLASYTATCENLLDKAPRPESSDNGYYQAHHLFIYGLLTHANRLIEEYAVNSQVRRELDSVRSRLLTQTKNDGQKSLYLFFRQENSFISSIFKNPVFRNYRRVVDDITEMLEVIVGR